MEGRLSGSEDRGGQAPAYPIGSVDSALRLLLMFGEQPQVRVAEASKALGVARSTAHRLLQMLLFYGFVRQDADTRAYTAGPVWVNMGLRGVREIDIRSIARPHLVSLADRVGETVQLLALQPGGEVVCLDAVEGPALLRAAGRLGAILPAHGTAGGRVLLAGLPDSQVANLYPKGKIAGAKLNKVKTSSALKRELLKVRKQGYAIQRDELERGVSAVAAPIRDAYNEVNFAIDVVLPSSRLRESDTEAIVRAAMATAGGVSSGMAF